MAAGNQNLVGARVRKLRTATGVSQEDLAARCGSAGWDISRSTLAKVESGLRRVNDAELLILAKALKRPVADLLDGHTSRSVLSVLRQGREDA
jgi:transcriptional regulator with XRE-family HTH domain